jgi:hypothetical protein
MFSCSLNTGITRDRLADLCDFDFAESINSEFIGAEDVGDSECGMSKYPERNRKMRPDNGGLKTKGG